MKSQNQRKKKQQYVEMFHQKHDHIHILCIFKQKNKDHGVKAFSCLKYIPVKFSSIGPQSELFC